MFPLLFLGYPLIICSIYIVTSFNARFIFSLSLSLSLSLSIYLSIYLFLFVKKYYFLYSGPALPFLDTPRYISRNAFLLTCVHATHCSQGKNEYRAARTIHIGGWRQPDNDGVQIETEPNLDAAAYANLIRECRTHHQGNVCVSSFSRILDRSFKSRSSSFQTHSKVIHFV